MIWNRLRNRKQEKREYLSCYACGYSQQGITSELCPECGVPVADEAALQARQLAERKRTVWRRSWGVGALSWVAMLILYALGMVLSGPSILFVFVPAGMLFGPSILVPFAIASFGSSSSPAVLWLVILVGPLQWAGYYVLLRWPHASASVRALAYSIIGTIVVVHVASTIGLLFVMALNR